MWAKYRKILFMGIAGALGGAVGGLSAEMITLFKSPGLFNLLFSVALWFGMIGGVLSIALLLGQTRYLRRQFRKQQALTGVLVGLLAGGIAGVVAQVTYSVIGPTEFLRVICWGIAGGMLGFGLSFYIPNLGKKKGALGGAIGGVLGGILFVVINLIIANNFVARLFGVTAIGAAIGLMMTLIELLFREAWLEIHWAPGEQSSIGLGTKPVILGSSTEADIFFPPNMGFPPIVGTIAFTSGSIVYEDFNTKNKTVLKNESRLEMGKTTIIVRAVK